MSEESRDIRQFIRDIPDFPKPGIMFRDITPLLSAPGAFRESIRQMAEQWRDSQPDAIMAAEARGFIFAAPLALEMETRLIPVRKPGKLPFEKRSHSYDLEYGSDVLEIHMDAIGPGDRVLIIDDLLATGGTVNACIQLAQQSGAEVIGCGFVVELSFLKGRDKLAPIPVHSLVEYDGE